MSKSISCLVLGVLSLGFLAGCGGSTYEAPEGVIIKGKLTKGGQPLDVPRRDIGLGSVEIQFIPTTASSEGYREPWATLVAEDGTYVVEGAGQGVPPGTYKVVVLQKDQGYDSDALEGAYNEANTPIEIEVTESELGTEKVLDIELDNYPSEAGG